MPQMSPLNFTETGCETGEPPLPAAGVTPGVSVTVLNGVGRFGRVSTKMFGADGAGVATAMCDVSLDIRLGAGAPGPMMKLPSASMLRTVAFADEKHFEMENPVCRVPASVEFTGRRTTEAGIASSVTLTRFALPIAIVIGTF